MDLTATAWTLLPPVIAIALALITKEVYSSLLIGILAGALLLNGFHPLHAVETTFEVMGSKLGDNINICIFLVLLGILVSLVTKSGASRAYGDWAVKTIRTRRGASFATSFLGIFIFVDDYFNCLTVGTVMRPVTDKYRITRAKLAYIIDATAAPVCIIAPISSWAAAVGSSLPESSSMDGFSLFLQTIPMNLYALLTIGFLVWLMWADFDFGPMAKYEKAHKDDDLTHVEENYVVGGAGKVYDLILPICVLSLYSSAPEPFGDRMFMLVATYMVVILPYVYQGIRNNLNGVGAPRLSEAAQMLGASKFYAFFRVVIPNIMGGVTISVMLAMAIVFGDFVIINTLAGGHFMTAQMYLYDVMKKSGQRTCAVIVILFLVTLIISACAFFLQSRGKDRKDR